MTDDNLPARLVPPRPGETGRTHWEVTPLGIQMIEELAGRGCHAATIARALGMHSTTFNEVRRRDEAVNEAYQRGLAREHDTLVSNLRRAADEGNIVANIYLLKARHGLWDQPSPAAMQVNVGAGVLVVPQRLSMEEFLEHEDIGPQRPEGVERIPGRATRRGVTSGDAP